MSTSIATSPASSSWPAHMPVDGIGSRLSKAIRARQQSDVVIAYHVYQMKTADGFRRAGYRTQGEYFATHGINRWAGQRYLRMGKLLSSTPLQRLLSVPAENARKLLDVHPATWLDYPWIEDAIRLPYPKFARMVDERGNVLPSAGKKALYYRCRVTPADRESIEAAVLAFKRKHKVSDVGAALAIMTADTTSLGTVSMQTSLREIQDRVAWLANALGKRGMQVTRVKERLAVTPRKCRWKRIGPSGKFSGRIVIKTPKITRAMILRRQLNSYAKADARYLAVLSEIGGQIRDLTRRLQKHAAHTNPGQS